MLRDPFAQTNEESGLIRAWDALRRRRTLAAVVFATLMASAVSFARYLPDLYQASALVLVERPVLESAVRPAISGELEGRLHVIKQEILSRGRLTELIERFNLYPERRRSESLDSILDQTRKDILVELNGPEQVSGRTKTVAFRLSYTGEAKTTVADVTNAIAAFTSTRTNACNRKVRREPQTSSRRSFSKPRSSSVITSRIFAPIPPPTWASCRSRSA